MIRCVALPAYRAIAPDTSQRRIAALLFSHFGNDGMQLSHCSNEQVPLTQVQQSH